MKEEWQEKIFTVEQGGFDDLALDIFRFQYAGNALYRDYADLLGRSPRSVGSVPDIPFLPVRFFKSHAVRTTEFIPELVFESSGTTATVQSHHDVRSAGIYSRSFLETFTRFYGQVHDWCIIGLLPAYLERTGSSLVYMVDALVKESGHPDSGFYLYDFEKLSIVLKSLGEQKQKTLLIGVSFALQDFAENFPMDLSFATIMETGGMKGRKKEILRQELHVFLQQQWNLPNIHSEYGMTELLSQAYSKSKGIFYCPPWMKILLRDEEDPLRVLQTNDSRGAINVIDLANIYSCSFIATDDAGLLHDHGGFEVLGRMDGSDLRGCSLMVGN
jgi:hypothetical protein